MTLVFAERYSADLMDPRAANGAYVVSFHPAAAKTGPYSPGPTAEVFARGDELQVQWQHSPSDPEIEVEAFEDEARRLVRQRRGGL